MPLPCSNCLDSPCSCKRDNEREHRMYHEQVSLTDCGYPNCTWTDGLRINLEETTVPEKLYVLVRGDLSRGQQLAQSIHAAVELQRAWDTPETVVVLEVKDQDELFYWLYRVDGPSRTFYEPDYDEYTAIAIISTGEQFASLKLAGKESKLKRLWRKIH